MTVTQANEVNRIVEAILRAPLEFELCVDDVLDLVKHANKALMAGESSQSFMVKFDRAVKKAKDAKGRRARA